MATARARVPNSPTSQVLEAGPDFSVQVDVSDWSQTSLYKRLHSQVISLTLGAKKKFDTRESRFAAPNLSEVLLSLRLS